MLYTIHLRTTAMPDAVSRAIRGLGWELQNVMADMEPDEMGATGGLPAEPSNAEPSNAEPEQALQESFGARVPETGKPGLADLDSSGMPWDRRIHSPNMTKTKEGLWRKKKGVHADTVKKVEAERRVEGTVNGGETLADEEGYGEQEPQDSAADDFGINAAQQAEEATPEPSSEPDTEITKDQLRDKLKEVSRTKGLEACLSVLQQFDAQNVSGLDPADYAAVHGKLASLGAQ